MSDQIIDLFVTQSPTQSLDTGEGYFPEAPGVTLADGTILFTWRDDATQDDPAGTGNFDPFLSFQNSTDEKGANFYNGATHGTGDAIIAADNRTSLLKTEVVPVITVDGIEYYEFRLDVNETGGQKSLLSLESFKIFGSNSATETGDGLDPLYSIDANGINTTINIWDDNSGSGRSDVVMLIPKSYFTSDPEYLYFEAKLSGTDAGFEEFSVYVLQQVDTPLVSITKDADVFNANATDDLDDIVDAAGDVIRYTVTVSNAGNVTLDPTVVDSLVSLDNDATDDGVIDGDTNDNALLDVGETWTFKGEYTVTQSDLDNHGNYDSIDPNLINDDLIRNVAGVTTTQGVSNEAFTDTPIDYDPRINLIKTADVFNANTTDDLDDIVDAAGDVIKYTITAENTGNITLTNAILNDPLVANLDNDADDDGVIDGDTNENGLLDVEETWTWTGSYTVTQADIDARGNYDSPLDGNTINDDIIRNEVGVTVDEGISDDAFVNTAMIYDPLVSITKDADVFNANATDDLDDIVDAAGDVIRYTVTVSNAGNVTLDPTVVDSLVSLDNDATDDGVIDGDTNDNALLDVGETWTFKGEYTVTQSDLDNHGNYDSIDPNLINDDLIRNVAGVTTTQGVSNEAFTDTPIDYDPRINLIKTADVFNANTTDDLDDIVDAAGDVIKYTITAENTGNITLTNAILNDPLVANLDNDADDDGVIDGDTNENGLLDVEETWTWTGSYTVTQADIDARGNYDSPLDGNTINDDIIRNEVGVTVDEGISDDAFVNTAMIYDPLVSITKDADVFNANATDDLDDIVDAAGDVIRYTVTVSNAGNVTLDPTVVDSLVSLDNDATDDGVIDGDTNDNALLDVGETWTFKGEYTVTQSDLDNHGNYDSIDPNLINDDLIRNVAGVTTTQGVSNEAFTDTPIDYDPRINLIKTADVFNANTTDDLDDIVDAAGDVIKYTITAENTGNITLTNAILNDPLVANLDNDADDDGVIDGDTNENGLLDVEETWTWTGSYTVTQADIDARGNYDSPLDGNTINDDIIRNEVGVTVDEGISDDAFVNTAMIYDPLVSITKDADVFNANATDDLDDIVDAAGDVIRYTVTVSNAGNVTLDPTVVDSLVSLDNDATDDGVIDGDTNDNALLDVGETWTFKGEYTVTQSDLDNHGNYDSIDPNLINDDLIRNVAGVTTTQGVSNEAFTDTPIDYDPRINLIKTADVFNANTTDDLDDIVDAAGDVIKYTITAENTGNITLTNAILNDPLVANLDNDADDDGVIDGDTNENGLLDVEETWTWTGSYTVTQADIDARGNYDSPLDGNTINDDIIRNEVSVNTDQDASDEAYAQNSIAYAPEIGLLKTSDVFNSDTSDDDDDIIDMAGDVIKYTVTTQNTGNITLTNVALVDPLLGSLDNDSDNDGFIDGDSNQDGELDVGETWSWTGFYTVTQADLDARGNYDSEMDSDEINDDLIRNDVSVNTDQGATDEAYAENELIYDPDLGVIKAANVEFVDEAGDIIVYTIAIKNEGNITLDGVSLNDAMLASNLTNDFDQNGVIDGDQNENSLLDVGETWTWTGEYMVTEEDIQAAMMSTSPFFINNTAYADSNQTDEESASETVSVQVYFEGLSHGYWKNHQSDWDGVSSSTSFEEFFFGSQESSLQWLIKNGMSNKPKFVNKNDITFDQALNLTGGAEAALAREAVAAILNIRDEDVTYRYTEEQVKEWVSEALTGQAVDLNNDGINEFAAGMDAITGVKDLLDMNNNLELV